MTFKRRFPLLALIAATAFCAAMRAAEVPKGTLYVGWSSADITPERPVALEGQMHTRISKSIHDRLTATALALETREGETRLDEALMVSADLCAIPRDEILEPLRNALRPRLPGFDVRKLLINATHTHTGPVIGSVTIYALPDGIMTPAQYRQLLIERLTEAAVAAWQARKPALFSMGMGFAVVGHNRRAVYADGSAQMYGSTSRSDFSRFEGYEDHAVQTLYFWTPQRKLTGVAILVPCPSQVNEHESYLSADFWSDVRRELRRRHGQELFVYPMNGASGDQSPHLLFRKTAEELQRRQLSASETEIIARRIAAAVDEPMQGAQQDAGSEMPLAHRVALLPLPRRMVTAAEAEAARKEYDGALKAQADPNRAWHLYFGKRVMDRYRQQIADPSYPAEVHAVRLGDAAIVTNPFELFLDYGVRMEARSPAIQTLVMQLSCGDGGYLPTAAAIQAGSYSTKAFSNEVGPQGGDVLVDESVRLIQEMWAAPVKRR